MEHYPFPVDDDDDDMTPEQEQKIREAFKKKPLSDEDVQKFCNHPLVIKEITPEALQTEQMQALQSLMYDGKPQEIAMNLKSRGDQFLQNKDLNKQYTQNARSCYEEGLDQKPDDIEIVYLLRLGVLRCNLLLGNFGRVEKETGKILDELKCNKGGYKSIDTKIMQILHYQAEGFYGLQNYSQAINNCKTILKKAQQQKTPSSSSTTKQQSDIRDLMKISIEKDFKAQKIQDQIKTIQMHNKQTKLKVFEQICELKLVLGPQAQQIPLSYEASITIDEQKYLSFPILLIYPQHNTTDYISQAHQLSFLREHLVEVLKQRPTWDEKDKKYNINTIQIYYQLDGVKPYKKFQKLHESRLITLKTAELSRKYRKVNMKKTVIELLQSPGLVIPQYPIFYIVSSCGKFRQQFVGEER